MMTLEEIRLSKVNLVVVREAYDHASKRLSDILDTKKSFEQKAFTLFNGYITVSLALFGVGGALFKQEGLSHLTAPFLGTGLFLIAGAICFVLALMDNKYGALASSPDMWLNQGTIDGDDSVLPLMLAYITFYHQERIDKSTEGNERKAIRIRIGIILGVVSPFVLLVLFAIPTERYLNALFH